MWVLLQENSLLEHVDDGITELAGFIQVRVHANTFPIAEIFIGGQSPERRHRYVVFLSVAIGYDEAFFSTKRID